MANAQKHDPNDGYVPFKQRFLAWWDGVDTATVVERPAASEKDRQSTPADPNAIVVEAVHEERPTWPEERIALARRLWEKTDKDEVVAPGGAEYTVSLLKPMALTHNSTALDFSAGLGGGARRAARDLGAWLIGMELDPDLAARGMELSSRQRMERKAPVEAYEQDTFELPVGKFDGVLAREVIHTHRNKQRSLDILCKSIKPRGHLILTDLVLATETASDNRAVKAWMSRLPEQHFFWTANNYKRALSDRKMDIRVFQDDTETYRAMILEGWQRLVGTLKKEDLNRNFVDELMHEAEYWLLLVRAIEFGAVQYLRAHAMKGGETRS